MVKILTERAYNNAISRQVVYEWEDDFCRAFGTSLEMLDNYDHHPVARFMRKVLKSRPITWNPKKDVYLYLAMNIDLLRLTTWYLPNTIPILFDVEKREIPELIRLTKKLPVYYVTSRSIYDEIKTQDPANRVECIYQSVAEKHLNGPDCEKTVDFVQFGRRNPVLHRFAVRYCDEHPGAVYCYRDEQIKRGLVAYRNGKVSPWSDVDTREEFIDVLRRTKISLCSTPLSDQTRDFGADIDLITARWFESVACGCFIIGRWTDRIDPDFRQIGLSDVAANVNSYEEFEKYADDARSEPDLHNVQAEFLKHNTAWSRAQEVRCRLEKLGVK